jgi:hypothetical protein
MALAGHVRAIIAGVSIKQIIARLSAIKSLCPVACLPSSLLDKWPGRRCVPFPKRNRILLSRTAVQHSIATTRVAVVHLARMMLIHRRMRGSLRAQVIERLGRIHAYVDMQGGANQQKIKI